MEVRATRVDVEAAVVSRVIDPDPRTQDALHKVLEAGESATATNLAEETAADTTPPASPAAPRGAEVAAPRTDFDVDADGIAELQRYDDNHDRWIDQDDAV
jgi:hypothetical protein